MKTLAFFFALQTLGALAADKPTVTLPTLTIGTKTFANVTISLKAANRAGIIHEAGASSVDPLKLPEEIRAQLGYDPAAAKAADKTDRAAAIEQAAIDRIEARKNELAKIACVAEITVSTVTGDGLLGDATVYDAAGKYVGNGTIFIATPTKGAAFVSDKRYEIVVVRSGTFNYTTVLGASRTVEKYSDIQLLIR